MSRNTIVTCDRCGKQPINEDYTLMVRIASKLPESGGITFHSDLNSRFDFCGACKSHIIQNVLGALTEKVAK